jgi:hypothetical protein
MDNLIPDLQTLIKQPNISQNGLNIGKITGIAALVGTAITFAMTYLHCSQSE